MTTRSIPESVARLLKAVLSSSAAVSTPAVRQAVADRAADLALERANPAAIPVNLETYVDKAARHAYKVLDRDVDALRTAGYSVDEIFEITVAAAVGAGLSRMTVALAALEEEGP